MSNITPAPFFPKPPAAYDQRYFAQLVRNFAVFAEQSRVPGPVRATELTLTTETGNVNTGILTYNSQEDTLDLQHLNGVVQQIGFETFMRCKNDTGSTIPNGAVVGFAGVNAEIKVAPYIANASANELFFVGVTTFEMADQAVGPVTLYGKVRGINTTGGGEGWVAGDILYVSPSTAGGLTKVRPTAPNVVIPVAAVLSVHATEGSIMVRPTIPLGLDYGTFASTADQTLSAIDTATAISFNVTEITNGVTLTGSPTTRLTVAQSGFYQVAVSTQLTSTSASPKNIFFWLAKNGSAIADTTRALTLADNNAFAPFSTLYDISLAAGDYVEVMWAANSTDVVLDALAASAFAPAAPSALVTVSQIQL